MAQAPPSPATPPTWASEAFVKVGGGRGFLVAAPHHSVWVVTAAHCLWRLPPAHPASYTAERTYARLLGPWGKRKPSVFAECLFVDPVADLAVLSEPDSQDLSAEWDAYQALVAGRPTLRIRARALREPCHGWLLTLDGRWSGCTLTPAGRNGTSLSMADAESEAVAPGTSGSPILVDDGSAVAVVSVGSSMNPMLAVGLPDRVFPLSHPSRLRNITKENLWDLPPEVRARFVEARARFKESMAQMKHDG